MSNSNSEPKPILKKVPTIQEKPKVIPQNKEVNKDQHLTIQNNIQQTQLQNLNMIQHLNTINLYPQNQLQPKSDEQLLQQIKNVNLYQPKPVGKTDYLQKPDETLLQQVKFLNFYQPKPVEEQKIEKTSKKELPKIETQKKQIPSTKLQKNEKGTIKPHSLPNLEPFPQKLAVHKLPEPPKYQSLPFRPNFPTPIPTIQPLNSMNLFPTYIPKVDDKNKKQKVNHRWTEEENKLLKDLVAKYGPKNWKNIAEALGNRHSADQCNQHWHRVVDPNIVKGDWTQEEDDLLMEKVQQLGESSWTKVAEYIEGRTDIQCRHRYFQKKKENKMKLFKTIDGKKIDKNFDGTSTTVKNFSYLESKAMNVNLIPSNEEGVSIKVNIEEIGKINEEFIGREFPLCEAEEELLQRETLNQKKFLDFSEILKKNVRNFHHLRKPIDLEKSFYKDNVPKEEKEAIFQSIDVMSSDNTDIIFASEILLSLSRVGKRKLEEVEKIKSSIDEMIERESKKTK